MGDIYIRTNDDHQVKISTSLFNDSEYLNYLKTTPVLVPIPKKKD